MPHFGTNIEQSILQQKTL